MVAIKAETYRTKTFTLRPDHWGSFRPGQHIDVRLTAPDGYQAQRSYSIASSPDGSGVLDISVELVDNGEVSPFFHEVVREGDTIDVRGPIGGPFTWTVSDGGPLMLVAGGSGIVPLMSRLRHRTHSTSPTRETERPAAVLVYSSRSEADIIYREELDLLAANDSSFRLFHTLTRDRPQGWSGLSSRVNVTMLKNCMSEVGMPDWTFVCGPAGFVEAVATIAVSLGLPQNRVRTERFGPSGS